VNPLHYGAGSSGAAMLAIVLSIIAPKWTGDQDAAVAGLVFLVIAGIHATVNAYWPPKGVKDGTH
jgi:hypothetical protein